VARGFGTIYRRKTEKGSAWWIAYSVAGVRYQESSKSKLKGAAVELLKQRHDEVQQGRFIGPRAQATGFDDLVALLKADYEQKQRRSLDRALRCTVQLRRNLGRLTVAGINYGSASKHVSARLAEKAAHATVRMEIAILGRMLTLAVRSGCLAVRPPLPLVEVRNTRTGFYEPEQVEKVLAALPENLRPMIEFFYLTGWRRAEVLGLRWPQVDFAAGVVRLEPGTTKNLEGRTFPFGAHPRLAGILMAQYEVTQALQREKGSVVPWVFHREGKKIVDFRDVWMRACEEAGVPGRFVHDFRRTAVRNLVTKAGVSENLAMRLTGHKTRSVFDRYHIVAEADLHEAVVKLATATTPLRSESTPNPSRKRKRATR